MSTTGKTIVWLIVIILIVWLGYFLVTKPDISGPATGEPITIGFIGPLTGDGASIGQNAMAATQLAVEEVNEVGGIDGRLLEVIYEDGKCNGRDASNAANKLINVDEVPVILGGGCSSETSAFAGLAEQTETVVLSYCSTAPPLTEAGDYIFRNMPSDIYQGEFAADYVYNTLGVSKVAILFVKADWGVGISSQFVENFEELGGTITANEGYEQTARDLRSSLTKIKASEPELLYFVGYSEASIPGLKQARELGLDMPILGADAWDDPKIWADAGEAAEGISFVKPEAQNVEKYRVKMQEKTGSDEIGLCSPTAYDGVYILSQVMNDVGTDSTAIKDALYQVEYTGGVFSSEVRFDENGDVLGANYIVKKVSNGVATKIGEEPVAEGDEEADNNEENEEADGGDSDDTEE
ncbi:MAG: ABC transporter substrate-binding protein [Patescibacteria group bacterium]|nr:ABC transporter substrate-binding protein [Patescibacteria group bacterium]